MSDRADERVTTIREALDGMVPFDRKARALSALVSLAADAAETQTLREELEALSTLAPLGHHEMADFVMLPRRRWRLNVRRAWRYRAERDAAVADRDRLAKALLSCKSSWTIDFNRMLRLAKAAKRRVEYGHNDTCDQLLSPEGGYACTCGHDDLAAALAGREGSDDA